jgi:hypothetical protein
MFTTTARSVPPAVQYVPVFQRRICENSRAARATSKFTALTAFWYRAGAVRWIERFGQNKKNLAASAARFFLNCRIFQRGP